MMNITPVVKQLLIINIIFFIGSQIVKDPAYDLLALHFFENDKFGIWQPITHMFMHAGIYEPGASSNFIHIFFNMFALFSFGSALEHFWGGKKFLFFYISCGLGSALLHIGINYLEIHALLDELATLNLSKSDLHTLLNFDYRNAFDSTGKLSEGPLLNILESAKFNQEQFNTIVKAAMINQTPMVGASGAIYGLLVAFAFMFPNATLGLMFIPIPIKAKYFVAGLLVMDLVLGLKGSSIFADNAGGGGVAHFAHIGGALAGFLMMWYWKKNQFTKNRWN